MSKLSEILDEIYQDKNTLGDLPIDRELAEQAINALVAEVIGEDRLVTSEYDREHIAINEEKAEQRKRAGL